MRLVILLSLARMSMTSDLVAMGCDRDPSLSFCKTRVFAAKTHKEKQDTVITEKDKQACAELRMEYVKVCAMSAQHKAEEKETEFCQAFENICFRIPKEEPDQQTIP
uniref:CX9C domain-containing protein n=1 Tax=Heterorhabditis bacteriophora TaxID=37862 RepID=A0A1I7X9M4_HETBA